MPTARPCRRNTPLPTCGYSGSTPRASRTGTIRTCAKVTVSSSLSSSCSRTEPVRTTETENRAEHLGGPFYELTAQVVAVLDHVWIIDCGILAHQVRRQIASDLVVGDVIHGRAYLGLEGYGEFAEGPNAAPHMPALVYSWTIDSLLMNTTPWLTMDGGGLRRDETRRRYQPIQRTDASSDDDGRADYLLTCTKQTVDRR